MLQGVVDMHNAGWAHLDIKPDNVCMELKPGTPCAQSYVIDYGSALKIGTGMPICTNVGSPAADWLQREGQGCNKRKSKLVEQGINPDLDIENTPTGRHRLQRSAVSACICLC